MQQILFILLFGISISGIIHGANKSIETQTSLDEWAQQKEFRSIGTQTSPIEATQPQKQAANPTALKQPIARINLQARDRAGNTPLHDAASRGDNDFIKNAFQFGAMIDAVNFDSKTPLYLAIEKDKFLSAAFLITCGADINKRIGFGYTLLLCAIDRRDMITAEKILLFDPDLAAQTWICNNSALHLAIAYDLDITPLIKAKAPLDLPDHKWQTPIYTAIGRKKHHAVLQLAHAGASLTHQDKTGLTPEAFARKNSFFNLAKTLAEIHAARTSQNQ